MAYPVRAAVACAIVAMIAACSGGGGGSSGGNDQPSGPAIGLSTTSVTIPATQSGAALPAAQTLYVSNSGTGTLATPTATPADAWLDAAVVTSGAGYRISLRPNRTDLAVATHTTTVQVASAGATNSPRTVNVSWQITAASTPVLVVSPTSLTFSGQVGDADPTSQAISLYNGGTGSLGTLGATTDDAAWLTPSLVSTTVTVSAALGSLVGGDYAGTVTITAAGASNSPVSVPVTFHVLEPTISVSTATMTFAASVGGGAPPDQTRPITNSGTGTLRTFTATPSYTDGSGWITATVTGTGNTRTLTVGVTPPAGAGTYDGKVTVASANTTNGSVDVPVHLVVTATPPAINAAPTSLSFTMTAGTNPTAKAITVTNSGGGTLAAIVPTPSYTTGSGWMSAAVTGSGNSQTVTVSIAGSPAAGSYSGSLSLAASGASNTPVSIPVTLQVNAAGGTAADGLIALRDAELSKEVDCNLISTFEKATQLADISRFASGFTAAVTAGRLAYSATVKDACVVAIAGQTCAESDWRSIQGGDDPAACAGIFAGLVQDSGACSFDGECASGYCAFGSSCPGSCAPFRTEGQSCDPYATADQCAAGLFCLEDVQGGGACTAAGVPGSAGQPCADGAPSCTLGNFCDGGGICRAKIAVGQPCTNGVAEACVAGAACHVSTCRTYAAPGQSCLNAPCLPGTYCASGVCRGYPTLGQDCTAANRCGDGSTCVGSTTKTCADVTLGQSCAGLNGAGVGVCSDMTWCLGSTTKVCTAGTVAVGDPCTPYSGAGSSASTLCAASSHVGGYVACTDTGSGTHCEETIYICY